MASTFHLLVPSFFRVAEYLKNKPECTYMPATKWFLRLGMDASSQDNLDHTIITCKLPLEEQCPRNFLTPLDKTIDNPLSTLYSDPFWGNMILAAWILLLFSLFMFYSYRRAKMDGKRELLKEMCCHLDEDLNRMVNFFFNECQLRGIEEEDVKRLANEYDLEMDEKGSCS